jgi:hypothetical protein
MPVDDLKQLHPEYADRFMMLSKKLEGAGTADDFRVVPDNSAQRPTPTTSGGYHELAHEWDELVQDIRRLDGFNRFLLPQKLSQLRIAARNGPVISINVSKSRCDALILVHDLDDVLHIPLPNFTYDTAEALYQRLKHLVRSHGRCISHDIDSEARVALQDIHLSDFGETASERILSRMSALRDEDRKAKRITTSRSFKNPESEFESILAELWDTVAKPILSELTFSVRP